MAAQAAAAETLGRVAVAGGALVAAAYYSLFNVEGGKRAIVFNRVVGVKNEVRAPGPWSPDQLRRGLAEAAGSCSPPPPSPERGTTTLGCGFPPFPPCGSRTTG